MVPLVVIRCITYNQEPYIRDTLNGFIMQKTNFPFVAIVHDDASTDGTKAIISEYAKKYPDIIIPIYENENQYNKPGNPLGAIMQQAIDDTNARYVAYCEGDDYWIDSLKLQKQVDFLESHSDYGMCYTKVKRYSQYNKSFIDEWGGSNETLSELLQKNTIPTLSVLCRRSLLSDYITEIRPELMNWKMGDIPRWLYIAAKSKIKFLNDTTGVYRIISESVSHKKDPISRLEFGLNGYNIHLYFARKYNLPTTKLYIRKYWDFVKFFIKRPFLSRNILKIFLRNRSHRIND